MKKMFFFLTVMLFIVSCSKEESVTFKENTNQEFSLKSDDTLKVIKAAFKNMHESSAYLTRQSLADHFVAKMNFSGLASDIDEKDKLLSWISSNLSNTSFSSLQEAETEFGKIENFSIDILNENAFYFGSLEGLTDDQMYDIIDWYQLETEVSSNPCRKACLDNLKACHRNAFKTSMGLEMVANGFSGAGPAVAGAAAGAGEIVTRAAFAGCGQIFFPCMHNCPPDE